MRLIKNSRVLPLGVPSCGRASAQASRRTQLFQGPEFRKGVEIMQSRITLPAAAVREFSPVMFDADSCRMWVLQKIHVAGAKCPHCQAAVTGSRSIETFWSRGRIVCKSCKRFFDAHTGTILAGSSFDYQEIFFLSFLLGIGRPVKSISECLGVSESTVRDWRDRLSIGLLEVKSIHPIGEGTAARGGEGKQ